MKLKLTNVRLAFPDLFEAKEFEAGDGKPRYSATFLVEPGSENDKAVRKALADVTNDKHGAKGPEKLKAFMADSQKSCYNDGNKKDYQGFEGMMALAAHRQAKDGPVGVYGNVIDPQTGKVAVLTQESGKPYGGCYVNATVDFYVTEGKYPGVRCGLIAVQFAKDGDSFGGASRASADDFEPVEGADAEDIT